MKPRFEHDCGVCRFLGTTSYVDPWSKAWIDADLYFCPDADHAAGMDGTVVARVSDEPGGYASAPVGLVRERKPPFSTHGRALYIAWLAVQCDLLGKDN